MDSRVMVRPLFTLNRHVADLLVQALDEPAVFHGLQDARIGGGAGIGALGFGIVLAEAFQDSFNSSRLMDREIRSK